MDTLNHFLKGRGFTPDAARQFGIYLAEEDEVPIDGTWVGFPYPHMTGEWMQKFRRVGKGEPKYYATGKAHLYNPLNLGPDADLVVLCEGEFDCMSLILSGIPAVGVAGTQGFKSFWKHLYEHSEVVIAFDPDDAGVKAANVMKGKYFPDAYIFDMWPDGVDDFNDWYAMEGGDEIAEVFSKFFKRYSIGDSATQSS